MREEREVNWLQHGKRSAEDAVRMGDSFLLPHEDAPAVVGGLQAINRFDTGELGKDIFADLALELRGVLLDHFVEQFVEEPGESSSAEQLRKRSEEILQQDRLGFVRRHVEVDGSQEHGDELWQDRLRLIEALVESVACESESVYPVQVVDMRWEDGQRGLMLLSICCAESWSLSVGVAPYEEFFETERDSPGRYPVLERRWDEIPGDGSLSASLVLGLSGDLEGLFQMGFTDRSMGLFDPLR